MSTSFLKMLLYDIIVLYNTSKLDSPVSLQYKYTSTNGLFIQLMEIQI